MRNPQLYARLNKLTQIAPPAGLGGGRVLVANQGDALQIGPGPEGVAVQNFGESYRICCPMCRDSRFRLYISHAWGETLDFLNRGNEPHHELLKCWNENCQVGTSLIPTLVKMNNPMYIAGLPGGRDYLISGNANITASTTQEPFKLPGLVMPVEAVGWDHPAWKFLVERGHDPVRLSRECGFQYCYSSQNPQVDTRIIVPFYMNFNLCGWQARYIGADGKGKNKNHWLCYGCSAQWFHDERQYNCPFCKAGGEKVSQMVKWSSAKNMRKSEMLFNYDSAMAWPHLLIIVEGPMDVVRIGTPKTQDTFGPAVAVLGKDLSSYQIQNLLEYWRASKATVVVALDGDAARKSHEIAEHLRYVKKMNSVVLHMDEDEDPGDIPHKQLWERITAAVSSVGGYV